MYFGSKSLANIIENINLAGISNNQKTFKSEAEISTNYTHYPYALEKELTQAILHENYEKLVEYEKSYKSNSETYLMSNTNLRKIKNGIICNIAVLTRYCIEAGVDERLAFCLSDLYIDRIEELSTRESLFSFNDAVLTEFLSYIKESIISTKYSTNVLQSIKYIHSHLTEDISLDKIASYIKINPSYLSRIFTNETGTQLTNYINIQRVNKSKNLLIFTDLSILEVALSVGFSSQSYYTQQFKKYLGELPTEFRKKSK